MRRQAHVYYSGRVQGVGFRFTAAGIARSHGVSGFVSNLSDGRVELTLEGEKRAVMNKAVSMIAAIKNGRMIFLIC